MRPTLSEETNVETIALTFTLAQAREVAGVLPWLLKALEDRPELTARQRRRRQVTRSPLKGLLDQLTERLQAHTATHAREDGA